MLSADAPVMAGTTGQRKRKVGHQQNGCEAYLGHLCCAACALCQESRASKEYASNISGQGTLLMNAGIQSIER